MAVHDEPHVWTLAHPDAMRICSKMLIGEKASSKEEYAKHP